MRKHWTAVVCLSAFFQLVAAVAQTSNALDRPFDAVVIEGSSLASFLGDPIASLRLYRYDDATAEWTPIRFQVDELDGDGTYFGLNNGILDPGDEVVFLSRDMGDRASVSAWVDDAEALGESRVCLLAEDPLVPGSSGWVYAYSSAGLAPASGSYVQYHAATDAVESEAWEIRHGDSGFIEDVSLKTSAGGDGIDFVDRQKIRLKGRADLGVLGGIDFTIKEQMDQTIRVAPFVKVRLKMEKTGVRVSSSPVVRLHREMTLHFKAEIPIMDDVHVDIPIPTTYYPYFSDWASGDLPLDKISNIGDLKEARVSMDLDPDAYGMTMTNPYQTEPIRIDGYVNDNIVTTIDWPGHNWTLIKADPTYPLSVLNHASFVTLIGLEGDPLGETQEMYFKDNQVSRDGDDTGDEYSWGDTGILMQGDAITGDLNFYAATYYLVENIDAAAAGLISDRHFAPLLISSEEEAYSLEVTIDTDPTGLEFEADGVIYTAPVAFPWEENSVHDICAASFAGESEGSRYAFESWSNEQPRCQSITVQNSMTLTAAYTQQHFLTTGVEPAGSGDIDPAPPGDWFDASSLVQVWASPADGFAFAGWAGDGTGTENPLSISLEGPMEIIAGFSVLDIPATHVLDQNYPNPFNQGTTIRYGMPESGEARLVVLDAHGRVVRTLVQGLQDAGYHDVVWEGTDDAGRVVATGLYFIRFVGDGFGFVKKMIVMR